MLDEATDLDVCVEHVHSSLACADHSITTNSMQGHTAASNQLSTTGEQPADAAGDSRQATGQQESAQVRATMRSHDFENAFDMPIFVHLCTFTGQYFRLYAAKLPWLP